MMQRRVTTAFVDLLLVVAAVLVVMSSATSTIAQPIPKHFRHSADLPPGWVSRDQLKRGGPLHGYFQPVQIVGPAGSSISLVINGQFEPSQTSPVTAGMLIGQVYRFKVTGIEDREGFEVFPTIEVINRLYPPAGQKARFPIPVHLSKEELHMALDGLYVTRVIYLENPATALARQEEPGFQRYFEVLPGNDPLKVADDLGRPMAILRMGSRVPESDAISGQFAYGSPPLVKFPSTWQQPVVGELKSVQPDPDAKMGEHAVQSGVKDQSSFESSSVKPAENSAADPQPDEAPDHRPGLSLRNDFIRFSPAK